MPPTASLPECHHIFPGGAKCHAIALRGQRLCYFHNRRRAPLLDQNRRRPCAVILPPLEDRSSLQVSISAVLAALSANKIDARAAGVYLYGIQLAWRSLECDGALTPNDPPAPSPIPENPQCETVKAES